MGIVAVIAATMASYLFGSVWYMVLAKRWMAAAEVKLGENGRPANASSPAPYIVSLVCTLIVAGMMRHIFALSGISDFGAGMIGGLGIGLFLATPWIVTNYVFAGRPFVLMLIDGGYATIGCMIMGLFLTLF